MANSLLFAQASSGQRDFDGGTFLGTGAISAVAIAKPTATTLDANTHYLMSWNTLGVLTGGFAIDGSNSLSYYSGTGSASTAITVPAANEWYLFAFTKATGTSTPRLHMYRYSAATWTHTAGSGSAASCDDQVVNIRMPRRNAEYWDGSVLIAGCWDSQLADLAVEAVAFNKPAWVTAVPKEAWRFDTLGSFSPFVGTSTYGAAVNASLDTGDVPVGWVDVLGLPAERPNVRHAPGTGLW